MELRTLYPEIEPYATGILKVSSLHSLYYEECGNPQGKPILFLHGGPGAGLKPAYRCFFDPQAYRIVLLSQRGAVQSTPFGEIIENDTWKLVEDIETLRTHLRIDRWVVFGGSWGSTLALVYALEHRERVSGLILRGVFLGRKKELEWSYGQGADLFFPRAWQRFVDLIPEAERTDLIHAYYRRMTGPDPDQQLAAAVAWYAWEEALVMADDMLQTEVDAIHAISCSKIECHYMVHQCFFPEDSYLLKRAPELAGIPCRIIQGQLDFVCPPTSAIELAKAISGAELRIVPDGTHYSQHPSIASELVQATDDFRSLE